jgi:hypothetical protein
MAWGVRFDILRYKNLLLHYLVACTGEGTDGRMDERLCDTQYALCGMSLSLTQFIL